MDNIRRTLLRNRAFNQAFSQIFAFLFDAVGAGGLYVWLDWSFPGKFHFLSELFNQSYPSFFVDFLFVGILIAAVARIMRMFWTGWRFVSRFFWFAFYEQWSRPEEIIEDFRRNKLPEPSIGAAILFSDINETQYFVDVIEDESIDEAIRIYTAQYWGKFIANKSRFDGVFERIALTSAIKGYREDLRKRRHEGA